jgi:prophage tail gpP-like protein
MSDLALVVNGRRYGGWKGVRVTRSIESLAGSFDLDVSDRWGGQDKPWPIAEEDECRVEIDGVVVIDGYVDRRSPSISASSRSLSFSGRDRAAALVDNSVLLDKWTFRDVTILEVARKLAEPFGIAVSVQPGLGTLPVGKVVVSPGESPFDVLAGEAPKAGVLLVSSGRGGVVLTRAGSARAATPLLEAKNIISASGDYDASERFARYVVLTQVAGTDEASGEATRIRGEASDPAVRRKNRVRVIRPDEGMSADAARRRADWEARIRAARSESISVTVQGWTQPSGGIWPLNALVTVNMPSVGADGEMLISQIDHSLDEGGEITQLRLVRPDAFTPEPKAAVVRKGGGLWKELAGGAR